MKVKVPVIIIAEASKCIGEIEIESVEEYEDKANDYWEQTGEIISGNVSNDFNIGDSELLEFTQEDFDFYKKEQKNKIK